MLSYWESKTWFENNTYTIIGAGIVGLQTAIHLRKRFPDAKILVVERSFLPNGASTKNAGFACFGSIGELASDNEKFGEDYVLNLLTMRYKGLQYLKESIGIENLGYTPSKGYEAFKTNEIQTFNACKAQIGYFNNLLHQNLGIQDCFTIEQNNFGLNIHEALICNKEEGSINTGALMQTLIRQSYHHGINILWDTEITSYSRQSNHWVLSTARNNNIESENILFTTNAFSKDLFPNIDVVPYRNQVIVTAPIPDLKLDGTFHMESGFIYFKNIGNRLLLGGGRHYFMEQEQTSVIATEDNVINWLKDFAQQFIYDKDVEIEYTWSGILAGGINKEPIIKKMQDGLYIGVRLGGMGVAIGSLIGKELANLVSS